MLLLFVCFLWFCCFCFVLSAFLQVFLNYYLELLLIYLFFLNVMSSYSFSYGCFMYLYKYHLSQSTDAISEVQKPYLHLHPFTIFHLQHNCLKYFLLYIQNHITQGLDNFLQPVFQGKSTGGKFSQFTFLLLLMRIYFSFLKIIFSEYWIFVCFST